MAKRAWSEEHRRLCASAASLELEVGAALGAAHPARAEVERAALALAAPRRALARDLDARASSARRGVAALGGLMREASKGGEGAAGLLARLTTEMDESEAEILAFKESSRAKYGKGRRTRARERIATQGFTGAAPTHLPRLCEVQIRSLSEVVAHKCAPSPARGTLAQAGAAQRVLPTKRGETRASERMH